MAIMSEDLAPFFDLSLELLCIAGIDGRFRRINPAFESLLGYTNEELLARPFFDFMVPDDRDSAIAELASLRRGRSTIRFENRVFCKDGSIRCLAWTASPATPEGLIYAAARDITDAKAGEEALRQSEGRTRSIIDNLLGGLITIDLDGRIESLNPAGERMFGYPADALIGRDVSLLFDGLFERGLPQRAAMGRVTEYRATRFNGEAFVCLISLFEFDAGNHARHFAANVLDMSERDAVEQMKRDFVATVSHELRTPVTSIRGSLGLLAAGAMGELNDEAAKAVDVAERNSVRLASVINEILEFDKPLHREL